ncbi:MAG: ComF family protein [Anaerolineae bacterium]|nr:ComF family protein [Anaerolineae bacterium]
MTLYQAALTAVDWVFPPQCGGCGLGGNRWCEQCNGAIEKITKPFCESCGLPGISNNLCGRCTSQQPAFDAARSLGIYQSSLRNAVIKLKYKRDFGLGETLADQLLKLISSWDWSVQAVVPIPLGRERERERGYNQAALFARPIALGLGVPFREKIVSRSRDTLKQVGLTETERQRNVLGAFEIGERLLNKENLLLVDDVMTTGATLNSCAGVLKQAGAGKVYAITLARALDMRY